MFKGNENSLFFELLVNEDVFHANKFDEDTLEKRSTIIQSEISQIPAS